jgi:hypothetical protein
MIYIKKISQLVYLLKSYYIFFNDKNNIYKKYQNDQSTKNTKVKDKEQKSY